MGKNFRETLNERMEDPEFRTEWEALEPERQRVMAALEEQKRRSATQKSRSEASQSGTYPGGAE